MYVLKAKHNTCAPHSFQTDEPRNTKTDKEYFDPTLTTSAKFRYDRFTRAGAPERPIHVDFGFFFFNIFLFSLTWLPT
jgi:hypothetical protein